MSKKLIYIKQFWDIKKSVNKESEQSFEETEPASKTSKISTSEWPIRISDYNGRDQDQKRLFTPYVYLSSSTKAVLKFSVRFFYFLLKTGKKRMK